MLANITVESQPGRAFTTKVTAANHELFADEPVALGGDDLGPTPYELLLAGLGSCTAMTMEMYARRKGWPLEGVTIRLNFDRVHEKDSENPEDPGSRIERITREIEMAGPLDEAQRARLMEIAGKCPVHRTLQSTVDIRDMAVEPSVI